MVFLKRIAFVYKCKILGVILSKDREIDKKMCKKQCFCLKWKTQAAESYWVIEYAVAMFAHWWIVPKTYFVNKYVQMNSYVCRHLLRLLRNILSTKILDDELRGRFTLNHTFWRGDDRLYCGHLAIESHAVAIL
jgi:hypothetical protein